jgi:hypothetical protein
MTHFFCLWYDRNYHVCFYGNKYSSTSRLVTQIISCNIYENGFIATQQLRAAPRALFQCISETSNAFHLTETNCVKLPYRFPNKSVTEDKLLC